MPKLSESVSNNTVSHIDYARQATQHYILNTLADPLTCAPIFISIGLDTSGGTLAMNSLKYGIRAWAWAAAMLRYLYTHISTCI